MNMPMTQNPVFAQVFHHLRLRRGLAFGLIILAALLAFETFNYSTTEFALADLLGELSFAGLRWSTILAIAFCGIDFAGIARLFTPGETSDQPNEVWYLFGAWLLAATMNAMLTWWGVSIAVLEHQSLGNAVVARGTLLRVVPIFVAVLVWLIRVLIIGTFSVAGTRLFSQASEGLRFSPERPTAPERKPALLRPISNPTHGLNRSVNTAMQAAPRPTPAVRESSSEYSYTEPAYTRPEPTYHPLTMSAAGRTPANKIGSGQTRQ
ncbi:MAG: hypothetical protein ACOY16_09810 [Chloroflexota bacterium]